MGMGMRSCTLFYFSTFLTVFNYIGLGVTNLEKSCLEKCTVSMSTLLGRHFVLSCVDGVGDCWSCSISGNNRNLFLYVLLPFWIHHPWPEKQEPGGKIWRV